MSTRVNAFSYFQQEILEQVIQPKIEKIVTEHDDIASRSSLLNIFNNEHKCNISMCVFAEWCEDIGITFEKKMVVKIPGYRPAARDVQPVSQESADEAVFSQFDEPTSMPDAPATLAAGERMVLPGGMRAPTFLD
jgi:hypothetical protein